MQSEEEWASRGDALVEGLLDLLAHAGVSQFSRGLDIGCQRGELTDRLHAAMAIEWAGIDPVITETMVSPGGAILKPGLADNVPYSSSHFDCAVLANVFEHIPPDARQASMNEIARVLAPGGVVAGQIPNPYFPIESHSRLPFMGALPHRLQKRYWRLSRVPWDHDFYVVTLRHVRKYASAAGLEVALTRPFNYPASAIPQSLRRVATAARPIFKVYPWAWQFLLRKPALSSLAD